MPLVLRRLATLCILIAILCGPFLLSIAPVAGQEKPAAPPAVETPPETPAAAPADAKDDSLATKQDMLSRRYKRFVETLGKVAETLKKTDNERAQLLIRAIGKSNEEQITAEMSQLVELFRKEQLGDALDKQGELVTKLHTLLDLLLSEDRAKELAAEKKRLEAYLKDLNKLIAQEKDVRAATERGEPGDGLAERQQKITDKTAELGKNIDKDDAAKRAKAGNEKEAKPGDKKPGDKKPGDDKPGDKKPGEGEPKEGKPNEGKPSEGKPGEGKPGEGKPGEGKPQEGKPQEGQPQEGQPQEGQPQQQKPNDGPQPTPGRENLEKAKREMEKAIENLKKQQGRQQASDHQDEAVQELVKAKEKLEEILRQLREEERERLLAALEARFQRMLALQLIVYDGTMKLGKIPAAEVQARHGSKARELAQQEEEIALEATKAITLLREEGSAVAFPEAVEQMRDDMRIVARYLQEAKVGELTQAIEKEIIDALQEMIEALQKEMEKKDQKDKEKQQQQQQQQEQDKALVDQLAELKMLRSLQLRVNFRTKRLGRMVEGEQARQPDVISQLQNLAQRQSRIQEATYNLATGKNK